MKAYFFFIASIIIIIGCGDANIHKKNSGKDRDAAQNSIDGAKIFKTNCELCHGHDGKLGANGSKDLTLSEMTLEERIAIITNGKGVMTAFGPILSLAEIKSVAEFTMTLK